MEIGDEVCKKSRKPFQNKKRVSVIKRMGGFETPTGIFLIGAVLEGCESPVPLVTLTNDSNLVELMKERDNNQN